MKEGYVASERRQQEKDLYELSCRGDAAISLLWVKTSVTKDSNRVSVYTTPFMHGYKLKVFSEYF